MPKLKPGQKLGTDIPKGQGVEGMPEFYKRMAVNHVCPENGRSFRDAINEVNNYYLEKFGVPVQAVADLQKELIRMTPRMKWQAQKDQMAKQKIDERFKKLGIEPRRIIYDA